MITLHSNDSSVREGDHRPSPMVSNLQFNLLGNPEGIVHLHTQVSDGAFEFCVTKQNLDGSEIARLLVNLCRLGPPHGVGAIGAGFKANGGDPPVDNPSVLPGR